MLVLQSVAPYQVFGTKDGFMMIAIGNDIQVSFVIPKDKDSALTNSLDSSNA